MLRGLVSRVGLAGAAQRRNVLSRAGRTTFQQSRGVKTETVYNTVLNSNAKYVLFVVTGAAVGEMVYGAIGDTVWRLNNRGKLYEDIDWSKWESIYEDEEEEEEEEEDEE